MKHNLGSEFRMPKVSVIMATYNCEETIEKCVESIINQSFSDWEFIICDDCSVDNTFEILLKYQRDFPDKFIILQNETNSKLAFSLNRCLSVANGEYIARMDGDDESFPGRLKRQVDFLDSHADYDVVGTAMIPFDENGDLPIKRASVLTPSGEDLLSGPCFFHATIMMRKSAYETVNGYYVSKRTQRAQDYDMWFRFFAKGLKGYNLQEGLYHVREDNNAYRRRSFKSRCYEVQTRLKGYKLLSYPINKYIYAFKPIIAAAIPKRMMKSHQVEVNKRKIDN